VIKNAFRNKRRSILTIISISFSLLLLTLLMTIWRAFYLDEASADSALRLITRHRVSLNFSMPAFYREKIRKIPGVVNVVPLNFFGGIYKDEKPENWFQQFGTDPEEYFKVYREQRVTPEQLTTWQRDRAGAAVTRKLAQKYGWKLGDRVILKGTIYAMNLELNIRAIIELEDTWNALLYNQTYVEEAISWAKGRAGSFAIFIDAPESATSVAQAVDSMFHNALEPTRTETEKAFVLGFVNMLGNVKAFILSIALAVVFAILLVSANSMAMSIRERVREVAVLKTLGFTRQRILTMFVAEAVVLSALGGALGAWAAKGMLKMAASSSMGDYFAGIQVTGSTFLAGLSVAALIGFISAFVPSYRASRLNIVDGLRHVG
jgi:putative ABC transport system permease protein